MLTPPVPEAELRYYRQTIDNLDASLVYMLAERFRCTQRIGYLKANHELPPKDEKRETLQEERLNRIADEAGLDQAFVKTFFSLIIMAVIRNHQDIAAQFSTVKEAGEASLQQEYNAHELQTAKRHPKSKRDTLGS